MFVKNNLTLTFGLMSKMQAVLALFLMLFANFINSNQKLKDELVKSLPYIRMKMEEVTEDNEKKSQTEASANFASYLVENVKELFDSQDNLTMITNYIDETFDSASLLHIFRKPKEAMPSKIPPTNHSLVNDNYLLPFILMKSDKDNLKRNNSIETDKELLNILKNLEPAKKKPKKKHIRQFKRTCIYCDNILNERCSNPRYKLIPSIECQREDDLCYSQHTPFGIIDRGCFNVNHDLTLFVCACNLCNYISISEMPYIFSNKRDWVDNVIELSRAKRFRESIFKDMSCLRCEVNVTARRGNMIADANCLEGNIATLPRQRCTPDEICGVKSIRSEGYIWRGCLSEPLYNYWWTLCNDDWCNFDSLVSIYDNIN